MVKHGKEKLREVLVWAYGCCEHRNARWWAVHSADLGIADWVFAKAM